MKDKMSIYVLGCCLIGLATAYTSEIRGVPQWQSVAGLVVFNITWWVVLLHKTPRP